MWVSQTMPASQEPLLSWMSQTCTAVRPLVRPACGIHGRHTLWSGESQFVYTVQQLGQQTVAFSLHGPNHDLNMAHTLRAPISGLFSPPCPCDISCNTVHQLQDGGPTSQCDPSTRMHTCMHTQMHAQIQLGSPSACMLHGLHAQADCSAFSWAC